MPAEGYVPTWKTREGRVMLMSEMGDSHLQNSINMVKRKLSRMDDPFPPPGLLATLGHLLREQRRRATAPKPVVFPMQSKGRLFREID